MKEMGATINARMGLNTWAAFYGNDADAVVAGDVAMLAAEVTPRFPGGFTVIDAKGQWRAPGSDRTSKERTKLLMIAMPPGADNGARLDQIVAAYKTRYRQQSVGLIIRPACVSF